MKSFSLLHRLPVPLSALLAFGLALSLAVASGHRPIDPATHPGTLFDTVAVHLAFSHELCTRERLGIRVDDKGVTRLDDGARQMLVATDWKSLDEFRDFLVERIVAKRR